MMVALLIAGIGLLLAGLVAIGFGIPINEFGFGNTLIIAGTVAACTGMLLLGLWMAVKELKTIARRLGPGAAREAQAEKSSPSAAAGARHQAAENQPGSENAGGVDPAAPSPPPWLGEATPRAPEGGVPAPATAEPVPAVKQRRNLLFSSSRKERERERAEARTTDPSMADPAPEAAAPVPGSAEPKPASFDDAWPKPERSRAPDVTPPRRPVRTPSTFAEAGPAAAGTDRSPPAAPIEEQPQVTVLKSGVVDGMAYSLYSDGSIEAQMPEGMMRFASIDELRAHLDHRP
jgi:hypothetical protein